MCHADDNIEPVDNHSMRIIGKGIEHKCRDYEALKKWTEDKRMPREP